MKRLQILAGMLFVVLVLGSCNDHPMAPDPIVADLTPPEPSLSVTLTTTPFSDDFESTAVGTLSPDYSPLVGSATVTSIVQRDGSTGHVLEVNNLPGEMMGGVDLVTAGGRSDVHLEFDQLGNRADVYVRSTGLNNGYIVRIEPAGYGFVRIYKVQGGAETQLAHSRLARTEYSLWRHFAVEARGNVIRVLDADGAIATATDNTFSTGSVLLAGNGPVRYDNVVVSSDLSPVAPATPITQPFSTGFDGLVLRDGALQQPNMDLQGLAGDVSYAFRTQSDGTTGRTMAISASMGSGAVQVTSASLSDVSVEFENYGAAYGTGRVYVRSTGVDNGYFVRIISGSNGSADIYKVQGGVETRLTHARPAHTEYNIWRRFTLEARGNVIRLVDADGAVVTATDNTFATGLVLFSGNGTIFDNVVVSTDLQPLTPGTPITLPYNTGFDDLTPRDGGLQQASLDLQEPAGGLSYGFLTESDGTTGRVMWIFGESGVASVEVASNGLTDARVEFENYGAAYGTGRVYVRASGVDNGYYVQIVAGGNGFLSIYKVQGGVETRLAEGRPARIEYGLWRQMSVETKGDVIRVTDGDGVVVTATDNTFPTGSVLFAGTGAGTAYDNIVITSDLTPRTAATPVTLPFSTGFDDLVSRDGALQQPNIDLQEPDAGVCYGLRTQGNGSTGRVMWVTGGAGVAAVEMVSTPISDVRVEFEDNAMAYGGGRVYVRASGVDNGYFVEFTAPSPSTARIKKVQNGVETVLAQGLLSQYTYGQWRRLVLEAEGNVIRFLDAGGVVATATDNTFSTGSVLFASVGTGAIYDNIFVDYLNPDAEGPLASQVMANPNPVQVNAPLDLTALVDDGTTGGSTIAAAEYSLDDGATWAAMNPVDGTFDEVSEDVTSALDPFAHPTVVDACVRGTDAVGNTGVKACVLVAAFDPTGGFATGAGWIQSVAGAYKLDDTLAGKAHFAFVSKYHKGASVPDGNASFRFQVADLDFRSTTYDWLVVNQGGTNAQFKGSGVVNGAVAPTGEDYRFMIWAGDDAPDTFRIKIWYEDGGEVVVYDNGTAQAIGAGNIKVHK